MDALPWIFLIEDSHGDALLLKTAFTMSDVSTNLAVAVNGEQALGRLQELAHSNPTVHPDLIVLDLNLPLLSGLELLGYLAGEPRLRIPIVVLTTSADHRDQCTELGIAEYLVKPSNFEGYLEVARRLGRMLRPAA